jgi:LysR family glycine cleavage system transcriptional activator
LHLYEQPIDATAPGEDIDLAITYGTGPVDSSCIFRPAVAGAAVFPGVQPRPVQPGHPENSPKDLARHCLLHDDQDGKTWTAWLTSHAGDQRPERQLYFAHAGLALEAAAQGQGVAMGDNLTAQEDLLSGRLVRPFTSSMTALGQYALVCERVRLERPAVAQMLEWFNDQLID